MTAYVNLLNETAQRDAAVMGQHRSAHAGEAKERLTPLENRLSRLLATIPDEVKREGLSLVALQASLKGRWRGSCHPGELGKALRSVGFVRRRNWSDDNGFRSMWHLPQDHKTKEV